MSGTANAVIVRFQGEGSGVADLTWAQRDVWDLMRRTGRTMNIGGTVPAEGQTVDQIATLLRYVMSRHQALRTRLRDVDTDRPQQVVAESGEIALELVDVGPAEDPDVVAEALRVRYQTTPFDPVGEWPVRMAVVRRDGVPTHIVVMYYHVAVDGFGIEAVVRDLAHLDRSTGTATAPPQGLQLLDLARSQQSPAARRDSARSLRHWEQQLRRVPPRRYADSGDHREPRYWEIVCESRAMLLAARSIAARTGFGAGPVLFAAYAVALARVTGMSPTVLQVLVNNRFRPGFADSVSNLRQFGLCVIDVAGVGFDEVVRRAWSASLGAFKSGYYDTVAHQELVDRVGRERGEALDLSFYLNDRRTQTREDASAAPPTPDELRAALADSSRRWGVREDTYDGSFYLHIEDVRDTVGYTMWADTHRFAPAQLERCAQLMEQVLVDASVNPDAGTGVGEPATAVVG